jgi:2-methylcitrate dehydratase PrpD
MRDRLTDGSAARAGGSQVDDPGGTDDPDPGAAIERLAAWAAGLEYGDVPERVRRAATAQRLSTVGAAYWTLSHPVGEQVVGLVEREWDAGPPKTAQSEVDCRATFLPTGGPAPVRAACYGHAALSMALDFDDTVLGGHTGHSSVFVPLAEGEVLGASGREVACAQVAANEVAARVAAAAAIGPFRGQQTAYVHAVAAAVARARLREFDSGTLADAIAIALAQPPWPLADAFLGSDAKLLTAAESVLAGLGAAAAAEEGLAGNRRSLDDHEGFLDAFADYPLPAFLGGLGERWHTAALTVKATPGCAYVTAAVEAALAVHERLRDAATPSTAERSDERPAARDDGPEATRGDGSTGGTVDGRVGIRSIDVAGSLFTREVDALADRHVDGPGSPLPALTFSVPYNVAVALADGEHTPRQLHPERVADEAVWRLAGRVTVGHDPDFTLRALRSEVPVGAMLRGVGWEALPYALKTLGPTTTLWNLPTLARFLRRRPLPDDFEGARKEVGTRVAVTLADGHTVESTCHHPPGFAGHPLPAIESLARGKLGDALAALDGGARNESGAGDHGGDAASALVEAVAGVGSADAVALRGAARAAAAGRADGRAE